ncbi:hypothetical protein [Nannocystis pusilla]|uniref:hypothetical protein n=1 Tax=Nannocystis pusilla TaxID=889268 RepID=UPI003B771C23
MNSQRPESTANFTEPSGQRLRTTAWNSSTSAESRVPVGTSPSAKKWPIVHGNSAPEVPAVRVTVTMSSGVTSGPPVSVVVGASPVESVVPFVPSVGVLPVESEAPPLPVVPSLSVASEPRCRRRTRRGPGLRTARAWTRERFVDRSSWSLLFEIKISRADLGADHSGVVVMSAKVARRAKFSA